ncbi:metalloregulator ArsR/SmtB family transcription factor [Rhizobium sp. L1K21]|uniref:ArsR/SmtB family transcription factor n=1 Tax=Rhizobium sp. L1K21 TaxID=2954933 RepID=UPI002092AB01|nr:metalloregulator ArsR/SmtB family transcription factor [Rhizobium sp. L1K21]MCO6185617.1 metalloregulator ArsR/SmtB family transcription factor [Rhizobium sp. L1K21]
MLGLSELVEVLKAAGETTRLRLLVLLSRADLTVSDLTDILGQSQPRISRHLKLLLEAQLIERYQEGAWAYFRLGQDGKAAALASTILQSVAVDDATLSHDQTRLKAVKEARARRAGDYFAQNAAEWDEIRSLHVPEAKVEAALTTLIGEQPIDSMLDLGTGTGRILQLFSGLYRKAVGIDASRDMLAVARTNLDKLGSGKASVRHGDIFNLPLDGQDFDLITIHQVLHFLNEPQAAIAEAARVLRPGGRLVIIDFAPHALEYLQEKHAHMRLGFSHEVISGWLKKAGLETEKIVDLEPGDGRTDALTVTIWLARDPRLLIA